MSIKVKCKNCNQSFSIYLSRKKTFVTCSKKCLGEYNSKKHLTRKNKICPVCSKDFYVKKSSINRRRYCSKQCQGIAYKTRYFGKNNPNYRGRTLDYDGYPLAVSLIHGGALHREVVREFLNLKKIPKGYHVHHKDCDIFNNEPSNLAVISIKDHQWLHKNFGRVLLWALYHKKIELDTILEWCENKEKAKYLLEIDIVKQIGIFKSGELLGTPEVDNQQPSLRKAKSIKKVQRLDSEKPNQ